MKAIEHRTSTEWGHGSGTDPELAELLVKEEARRAEALPLVASSSVGIDEMRAYAGSVLGDLTAEGYPGARYHPGCEVFDDVERLCVERAKAAFDAPFANVQPHSGTTANQAALAALAQPRARVLSMSLKAGGHLSHGAKVSHTSQWYKFAHYDVDVEGQVHYDELRAQALGFAPDVLICGASSYPRELDFAAFGEIARESGAALVADISHISGLVAAGVHPSPIPHAHLVTTSTYKQLGGPRGGLILGGRAADDPQKLAARVDRAVFPGLQGTPNAAAIAAKAWALRHVTTPMFADVAARIVETARVIADRLTERGFRVVGGGTDTHIVLVDVARSGIGGFEAEQVLERAGILVNRNAIPHDDRPPNRPSGIRLGTNGLCVLGAQSAHATCVADLVADVLDALRQKPSGEALDTAIHRTHQCVVELLQGLRNNDLVRPILAATT